MKKKPRAPRKSQRSAPARKSARKAPTSENGGEFWTLRLYVAGQSPRSAAAIANLRRICDTHLAGRYEVEIIDLVRHPELAKADQIVAIPTLVKKLPVPVRHIIGDLSATERVLVSLELMNV
ncbi:MAG TPA: circadian clock KaiB family protein [Candidatus Binataceae bacterium]|nr:circadian clock KaiB family protein [Candidatus Binataceae bacterium]